MATARKLIEWYRVDQMRRVRRALVTGTSILTAGALIMSVSFLTRQGEAVRLVAGVVGILSTIAGALTSIIGMARVLATDAYLTVSADGITFYTGEKETFLGWDDVERIRFDAPRAAVVFALRSGGEVVSSARYAGATQETLAARLDTLRRRAAFGTLR